MSEKRQRYRAEIEAAIPRVWESEFCSEGRPDLPLEALFVGVDPKREDVAAAIGPIGERVFRDGEGSARPMPGHRKSPAPASIAATVLAVISA